MEKESLFNKYRPRKLDDLLGNRAMKSALKKMLKEEKLPHTILFVGSTGLGKTTTAMILADNLVNFKEKNIHYINMSAQKDRGVEGSSKLIKESTQGTFKGEKSVYILDEVDQATPNWQSAMKSLLEFPSKKAYFILCTTKPNKLVADIRGRATTFTLDKMKQRELISYLVDVAKKEGETLSMHSAMQISEAKDNYRGAMVLLEQVLSTPEEYRDDLIKKAEPAEDVNLSVLCNGLIVQKSWDEIKPILKRLYLEKSGETIRNCALAWMNVTLLNSNYQRSERELDRISEIIRELSNPSVVDALFTSDIYELCK